MKVLGLEFFEGSSTQAVAAARGLCVFPSGPGLATLDKDARYREALLAADIRYADSGFLALSWFFLSVERLSRISGVRFLNSFFKSEEILRSKILWVHSSAQAMEVNQRFLEKLPAQKQTHLVAPLYPTEGAIADEKLFSQIKSDEPTHIIICLGSGIQEPLGAWLKDQGVDATILCTGGALDLITGRQVKIPAWADRLFLGWLFRILGTRPTAELKSSPLERYIKAWKLLLLLFRYRRKMPH